MRPTHTGAGTYILPEAKLAELFLAIQESGYQIIGPTAKENAISLQKLDSIYDLPLGYTDTCAAGDYKLSHADLPTRFQFSNSPSSPKRFLFPPREPLWSVSSKPEGLSFEEAPADQSPFAFFGIRPCDLRAIEIQDTVLIRSQFADTDYKRRRDNSLIIVVNCLSPSSNCFCASVGSGPEAENGYDIVLTELIQDNEVLYVAETGSKEGRNLVKKLALEVASKKQLEQKRDAITAAKGRIKKRLDKTKVAQALPRVQDSLRWESIAERCLACANCTLVCPTCFCTTIEDETDLAGHTAFRSRVWDSCFQQSFSHVAGGPIRANVRARYRQWLTHKLSYWIDQFGTIGCVGCGRCITWCPAGIDMVEEANAFVAQSEKTESNPKGVSP